MQIKSLVLFVACGLASSCNFQQARTPLCVVVANGFVGWVALDWAESNSAPLRSSNGCYWLSFENTNRLATSSKPEHGWARDRYFEKDPVSGHISELKQFSSEYEGRQPRSVQVNSVETNGVRKDTQAIFIGTFEEYLSMVDKVPKPRPR